MTGYILCLVCIIHWFWSFPNCTCNHVFYTAYAFGCLHVFLHALILLLLFVYRRDCLAIAKQLDGILLALLERVWLLLIELIRQDYTIGDTLMQAAVV